MRVRVQVAYSCAKSLIDLAGAADRNMLDDCIEAQVRGPLWLARDVEALVRSNTLHSARVVSATHFGR